MTSPSDVGTAPTNETLGATMADETAVQFSIERGAHVGRYTILSELGRGGMGVVYAAYDPELDRKVAIKLLSAPTEGRDSSHGRTRLVREAQALARLSHPNVVAVHDAGVHAGCVFVAMEFVEGVTLKRWLEKEKRGWRQVLECMDAAGEGLASAHAAGLVHRDFKPENVMVGDDGRARVMDFGLARAESDPEGLEEIKSTNPSGVDSLSSQITRAGAILGTPHYMAPEQHMGLDTDARTDQFNYCVTLYEALYGKRPFQGKGMHQLMIAVTQGEVADPPSNTDVPGWLRKLVVRGLNVDPEERWPSMPALLDALRKDPTRARRRLLGVGIGLALVGGLFGFERWENASARAACVQAGESVAEIWNDEVRGTVKQGVLSSDKSYAAETWDRVEPWLDSYAGDWGQARTQVCIATNVEANRSERLHARSLACLAERRQRLSSLVERLTAPDDQTLQRSVSAAASLSPIAPCLDDAYLADRIAPPDDPDLRERIDEQRRRLDEGHVSLATAAYADAVALAREVIETPEAEAFEPLQAEARLLLGAALGKQGSVVDAEPELERAFIIAGGVGHDEVAAMAAVELAYGTGYVLSRHADGLRWTDLGEMALRRTGGDARGRRARLLSARGVIHDVKGDFDLSQAEHEEALGLFQELLGDEHPEVALSINSLGTLLHARGDYDGALSRFEEALSLRRRALGPDHPDVAMSLNNVGAAYYSLGDHPAAIKRFEESLAIRERALGPDHPDVGQSLHNLAGLVKRQGDLDRALGMYEKALAIWKQDLGAEHPNVAATLDNIGVLEQEREQYEAAVGRHREALAIWTKAKGEDHPDVANCLSDLAAAELHMGEFTGALKHYERALKIVETAHDAKHPDYGLALTGVGEALLAQGKGPEAVATLGRAVKILEATDLEKAQSAPARFALARARLQVEPADADALALATRAREELRVGGSGYAHELARLDAWFDSREP